MWVPNDEIDIGGRGNRRDEIEIEIFGVFIFTETGNYSRSHASKYNTSKSPDDSDLRFFALASPDTHFQSFKEYEMKELYVGCSQNKK
jgi:hypothetical protein